MNLIDLETPLATNIRRAPPGCDREPFLIPEYGETYTGTPCYQLRLPSAISCIQYVRSGSGTLLADGRLFTPAAGDTILLHAGTDQIYYSHPDQNFARIWINLCGPLPEAILTAYGLHDAVLFPHTDTGGLLEEICALCDGAADTRAYCDGSAAAFLRLVQFLAAHRPARLPESSSAERLRLYLDRHICEPVRLTEMARQFHFSVEYLIRLFHDTYGITPHRYLLQSKIRLGMMLLRSTEQTVEEIADSLGFSDPRHFSAQFLKATGVRPSVYRRQGKAAPAEAPAGI